VLALPDAFGARRLPTVIGLVAAALVTLALAGPAWDRLPVPAFRSDEALVVALDLSRSMDAGDLEPSRLARARLKLLSLLDRRANGQTALVAFSAHAFTVTPLTTDTATVAALVGALRTDIMPSQGSYPEAGLAKAASLLEQAGMTAGRILLVTDADVSPQSLDLARELRRRGYTTSVLAAGTADGAPIPRLEGGFLTDDRGQVVVPQLHADGLRRLALTGGGRFAQLTADDGDLDALFAVESIGALDAGEPSDTYEADVWRDRGIWLTLLLLPLVALGFRRGWIYAVVACTVLPTPEARAFEWQDLWLRSDQQGVTALEADDPARAAQLFEDPQWGAAASYRAGDFDRSAQRLAGIDNAEANYNRGNALARSGDLAAAIGAYDRVLELAPDHADAEYNRELVRELLEQQEQQSEQQQQDQQSESSESEQEQAQASDDQGEQSDESQSDPGDQSEQQSSDSGEQRQADADPSDSESSPEDSEEQADNEAEPESTEDDQQQMQASVRPEDVEEWASEQAADQWLRRIPQDPGGLLRRKFLYQYQRLGVDQDGNYVWPGDEAAPW
jgi:Ca-activated chloride channel family protein